MKTVLVTGYNGFIGKNLIATLNRIENIEILRYGRENSIDQLREFVGKADFIFHLAGVNRPIDPGDFERGNKELTEQLIHLIVEQGRSIPMLISSSIQAEQDHAYGRSKRQAEEAVIAYGEQTDAEIMIYRLPNVFGKWCKPNYNSVVATFCYNIAHDLPIQIHDRDTQLNLVYIDEVVEEFVQAMMGSANRKEGPYCSVSCSYHISLGELADTLSRFRESRKTLVLEYEQQDLDRLLYSTYLSYLDESDFSYQLEMKRDQRGWLAEFIKSNQAGQIFISRTKPGVTRGNHWHHTKVEKFLVIDGEAIIKFRHISASDEFGYKVSGEQLQVLDIPPGYTHSITNTGDRDVITLFWANEIFNAEKPDTYYLEV